MPHCRDSRGIRAPYRLLPSACATSAPALPLRGCRRPQRRVSVDLYACCAQWSKPLSVAYCACLVALRSGVRRRVAPAAHPPGSGRRGGARTARGLSADAHPVNGLACIEEKEAIGRQGRTQPAAWIPVFSSIRVCAPCRDSERFGLLDPEGGGCACGLRMWRRRL